MLETLIEIERTMWTNNAEIYEAGYLSDAVVIFPGVGRMDRSTAVNAILEEIARAMLGLKSSSKTSASWM
jgi:hypothetical protein